MSLRQRIPFKFAGDAQNEEHRILDEQEQEELIQQLKDKSSTQNAQYLQFLQVVLALSCVLHLIYAFGWTEYSPLAILFPPSLSSPSNTTIPAATVLALFHIFIHANLSIHLLPSSHPIRQSLSRVHSSPYLLLLPLSFSVLLGFSAIAPVLVIFFKTGWPDIAWWSLTAALTWLIFSVQEWTRQESEGIRELEGLRYDAKGA